MSDEERVATPEVSFSLSGERLTLRDEAGGGEVAVELDGDTSLTRATTSWFDVPMDAAVSFETEEFRVPHNIVVWIRGADGESYGMLTEQETAVKGRGTFIDISAAMKVIAYIESGPVRGRIRRDSAGETAVVSFDESTQVVLGARSVHEQPTATMTVPDDPEALMEAVSYLGASIKEWSAERSWPTLRGYPPEIEIGDKLCIPDHLTKPDTGVTVAVPPQVGNILRVAPLAHYFGAEVVPGDRPELRICGYAEPLGTGKELERSVDELLARGLVLDSLVRIGGYYSLPRLEYEELAPELPFYPPELYDEPVDRQLLEYLEVSFEQLEPHVPRWPAVGTLRPSVAEAEALPYLLNSLARVHVTADGRPPSETANDSFSRSSTAWTVPSGSASLPPVAREAALAHERRSPANSSVLLVGGTPLQESCFTQTNWANHEIDGDVPLPDYRNSVTRDEFAEALRDDPLYVHFGNEVTTEGFVCDDGVLRFKDLPTADVGAFSFRWPYSDLSSLSPLFRTATVGCLTDSQLSTERADALGKYLVLGIPPGQSTRYVGLPSDVRYLGDSSLSLADHANATIPNVFEIEQVGDNTYRASYCCGITWPDSLGSTVIPESEHTRDLYALNGSRILMPKRLSATEVADLARSDHLLWFDCPVPDEVPLESVVHASRCASDKDEDVLYDEQSSRR